MENLKKVEEYIKGLLEINKGYKEEIGDTEKFYSIKWLEDVCNDLLKIINEE